MKHTEKRGKFFIVGVIVVLATVILLGFKLFTNIYGPVPMGMPINKGLKIN